MTPARKKALQWFADQGDLYMSEIKGPNCPVTIHMAQSLRRDGLVDYFGKEGFFNLTESGRKALKEG